MNRVCEDKRSIQLAAFPYPPTPNSQQTDTSVLKRLRHQTPNAPACSHPQPGNCSQLPPIRNLVPNLWEPGTSKSSHQTIPDEGQNGTSVYRLRPVGPVWGGGPPNASDSHAPHPRLEGNNHENDNRGTSRRVEKPGKRPPPSATEMAEVARIAPSNGTIGSNRGIISHAHNSPQTSNQIREKSVVRSRSNSEAANSIGEPPGNGPQSSHQELLRDPVSMLQPRLTHIYLNYTLVLF